MLSLPCLFRRASFVAWVGFPAVGGVVSNLKTTYVRHKTSDTADRRPGFTSSAAFITFTLTSRSELNYGSVSCGHALDGSTRGWYDEKTAPLALNLRMLKAGSIETLLHRCVTWTLSALQFARLRSVRHKDLLGVFYFDCRECTDCTPSSRTWRPSRRHDATALILERITRTRRCFFVGPVGMAKQGAVNQSCDDRDNGGRGSSNPPTVHVQVAPISGVFA